MTENKKQLPNSILMSFSPEELHLIFYSLFIAYIELNYNSYSSIEDKIKFHNLQKRIKDMIGD